MDGNDPRPLPVKIPGRIVGCKLVETDTGAEAADVDPRRIRIARRENGAWESVTVKIRYADPDGNGSKTLYFVIGFGVVCGRLDGAPVCIERPLEFFVPAGQSRAEQQWIAATMRSLSLAARGGFVAKALEDLRQVQSSTPVWFGKSRSGKTLVHGSEVAAIAWAMQQQLHRRGFLDERGEERSIPDLVATFKRIEALRSSLPVDNPEAVDLPAAATVAPTASRAAPTRLGEIVTGRCPDSDCQGDMVMRDGCPTCVDCGYSKCD